MRYSSGDIVSLDNCDWIVLFDLFNNDIQYWFVNAINMETEEFYDDYCFIDSNGNKVVDNVIIEELIPLMKNKLNSINDFI